VPGTNFRFYSAKTDTAGRIFFDVKDFYGTNGIVVQTGMQDDSLCKVDILSPFSEQYSAWRLPPFVLPDRQQGQLRALTGHSIDMQVQNVYSGDSLGMIRAPLPDSLHFFGRPDYTYLLDDYTRFTTMEEVLREYVREINVNRLHGRLHVLMLDEPRREFFGDNNTLVLLDGVPVLYDRIFSYDPLKVKKLEVVPRLYYLGPSVFSGIASFTTYKGDYEGLELDPRSILVDYEGLQWQREFYSPIYETERQVTSRIPDFRDLLFWSGDIHTDGQTKKDIGFFTSDRPGKYRVVVQGITADGRAGSRTIGFEVK
jgi:hypothetical protein